MKFLKLISAFLSVVLAVALGVSTVSADNSVSSETYDSFNSDIKAVENSFLKLNVKSDGQFSLTDKKSGITVYSRNSYTNTDKYSLNSYIMQMSSEIVVDYYNTKDAISSEQSSIAYSKEAEVTVSGSKDSIVVNYNFSQYNISFDLKYSVKDNYLNADIDIKSIKESGEYRLNSITLLPGFFSGTGDDRGYIFVPDGSGALIEFNNNSQTLYSADVYGEDISLDAVLKKNVVSPVRMPVFGMNKNGIGMFAVIDSGDTAAKISAAAKNSDNYYNYVNTTISVRNTFSKSMFGKKASDKSEAYSKNLLTKGLDKFSVRYYLLSENADYVQMASVYRDYLIKEKGLTEKVSEPVLNIDIVGAIDVKANFLGFTYYKKKPLTTYGEALEFIKELKDKGIGDVNFRYIGWSNNGITNNGILKKVNPINVLGGTKEFNKLNSYIAENKLQIDYDIEMLRFYKGNKKYRVSSPFNETLSFSRYLRSVYSKDITKRTWYMLTAKYLSDNGKSIFKSADKVGIGNISLSSVTNSLYSDYNRKAQYTRENMKNEVIKTLSGSNARISGETANAYAVPYLSKIYLSPCYTSGYNIIDSEIPFYQIVLHGMVDMTGESQFISNDRSVNYLKAIETGNQLLYTGMASSSAEIVDTDYDYLYGTDFDLWIDDALNKYKEYYPLLEKIYNSKIAEHSEIQDNVFRTVYENGIKVIVNYNEFEVDVEGNKVGAYGFLEVTE